MGRLCSVSVIFKTSALFKKRAGGQTEDSQNPEDSQASLSGSLTENLKEISRLAGTSSDVVIREFSFGREGRMKASLFFISGLADPKIINESI
jgi:spore germination protein KA